MQSYEGSAVERTARKKSRVDGTHRIAVMLGFTAFRRGFIFLIFSNSSLLKKSDGFEMSERKNRVGAPRKSIVRWKVDF